MSYETIIVFIILSFVTFALAIYLGILTKKLFDLKKKNKLNEKLIENHVNYLIESVEIISKATLQKQCEYSEACIRIIKLLEYFPHVSKRDELTALHDMYSELSDFAYLEDRKMLSKQEKFKQDNLRFQVEEKYGEKLDAVLNYLVQNLRKSII